MYRLILKSKDGIKVRDNHGNLHDYKEVPAEFYTCIERLYKYENTGFHPEEIEVVMEILEGVSDKLYRVDRAHSHYITDCCITLDAILRKRKKEKSADGIAVPNSGA